jgi:pyrroline-5-carboxylate reductase
MNVGLLGAGHIARALAEGWSLPGERPGRPERLTFFDVAPDRAAALAADTGGVAADDVERLVAASDVVIVAVRPPQVEEVLTQIGPHLGSRALVSVAAGVPLERLVALLPDGTPVGRVIPNVAAALRLGVCLFVPGTLDAWRDAVADLFGICGTLVELDEKDLDVATAVASCMPGYVARWVSAFTEAGVSAGLARETAQTLAVAGARGAAAIVAAAVDPAAVVAAAATPGGMTAAGVAALEEHDIDGAVEAAVRAAASRATRPA